MSNILAYVHQCVQWMGILSYAQESDVLILCYICVAFLQCVFSNVCTVDGHPDSDLGPQATSCLSHEPQPGGKSLPLSQHYHHKLHSTNHNNIKD